MLSDVLNPFLVKEVRQSLRSRFLHIAIIGSTLVCGLLVVYGLIQYGQPSYVWQQTGKNIFSIIYFILWIILAGVFPIVGGLRFYFERQRGEFGLFEITGISPGRIIRGKIQSSVILSVLITLVSSPFMLMCNYLTGISAPEIFFYIILLLFCALFSASVGILIGSLPAGRVLMAVLTILFAVCIFLVFFLIQQILSFMTFTDIFNPSSTGFSVVLVIVILLGYYFPLVYLASSSVLASRLESRTMGLRLFFLAFIVTGIAVFLLLIRYFFSAPGGYSIQPIIIVYYYLTLLPTLVIAQFALLKARRVCPASGKAAFNKGPLRLLKLLFYPGEGSLRIWYSLILFLLYVFEYLFMGWLKALKAMSSMGSSPAFNTHTLAICLSLILVYSSAGLLLNGAYKLVFKKGLSEVRAAVFSSLCIILLFVFLMAAGFNWAEKFFPFYYLFTTAYNAPLEIQALFILGTVLVNFFWGMFLFINQRIREKRRPA